MNKKMSNFRLAFGLQLMNFALLSIVLVFAIVLIFRAKKTDRTEKILNIESSAVSVVQQEVQTQESESLSVEKSESSKEARTYIFSYSDKIENENVCLFDVFANKHLLQKNEFESFNIGEYADIMACIVFLENCPDVDKTTTLEYEDFFGIDERNGSVSGFAVGERVKIKDLLYALLHSSSDEAVSALSRVIFGSKAEAVKQMNKKALEIGLKTTEFEDIYGEDGRTSCQDAVEILNSGLKNPLFREIFSSKSHTTVSSNFHGEGLTLEAFKTDKIPNFKGGKLLREFGKECGAVVFCETEEAEIIIIINKGKADYSIISPSEEIGKITKSLFEQNIA